MAYTTEQITQVLKRAREAQALSQRTLSIQASVPQGHISKIENGTVDLRISSLVELARVLGLEIMLVPRKSVPAVQALVRNAEGLDDGYTFRKPKELDRLQTRIARLVQKYPTLSELAQMQRQVNELANVRIPQASLAVIRSVEALVEEYAHDRTRTVSLKAAFERVRSLRNELAHGGDALQEDLPALPAYRLDEDVDG
ncbi:MAG: helix-turn-helix transcriptional regulator [Proteobacteria bacterium]|nr:helix-turn-helix transcriptional regulator [Pseudomonadota bacterium]